MLEVQTKYQGGARMSDYQQYLREQEHIDFLLQQGYKIKKVKENLSGAIIEFKKGESIATLHLVTAEGRKYVSVKVIQQQKEESNQVADSNK